MERKIELEDYSLIKEIFGIEDRNRKLLEEEFRVAIFLNQQGIAVRGRKANVEKAADFINKTINLSREGLVFRGEELKEYLNSKDYLLNKTAASPLDSYKKGHLGIEVPSAKKRFVIPQTPGQKDYIKAMERYDIAFSIGPAGTGKTYLAMAMAVNYLMRKKVRRIILTRPAIEAGESLGFLPGDVYAKLGPYLRPLYDALYDMMEAEVIEDYLDTGIIEIAPLAYMRGRTLNNAFVILDEAQNCTPEQLKMFLTRLGFDSKTVITGDITQSDLPGGKPMGLNEAIRILSPIKGIKFINLTKKDVVRHPLIQKIIQAYEDFYQENKG